MFIPLMLASCLMAADLTVGPSGDYATIGEAISASNNYDNIIIGPGTYAEAIWLTRNVTIYARDGLGSVYLDASGATGNAITIVNGTIRGLVVINAPGQAVDLRGSLAAFEQSSVIAPGGVGVGVSAQSPQITEVAVYDAGVDAFSFTAGSPVVQRCLAVDPAQSGYAIATAGTYLNLVSIGGQQGFSLSAGVDLQHPAALDASIAGLVTSADASASNGLFSDNPAVASCGSAQLELAWSLLYDSADSPDCSTTPFHDNLVGNPRLEQWSSGARPPLVDLTPRSSSDMVDAGEGFDADGSLADMGPMGGASGAWTDADGDGVPLHFDCDDTDPAINPGGTEVCSGADMDCDGVEPDLCVTCAEHLLADPTAVDGLYVVDLDGTGTGHEVWCDMNTDGGGWTLVQRTVWDWDLSSELLTGWTEWLGSTLGDPDEGNAYRMAGELWPELNIDLDHMIVNVARDGSDGSDCDPLYYLGSTGTLTVTSTTAEVTGLVSSVTIASNDQISTTDSGPNSSCVNSPKYGVPWYYGLCCITCPTYGPAWTDEPHPMASYVDTTGDLNGNIDADVCPSGSAVHNGASGTGSYEGMNVMEYYLR